MHFMTARWQHTATSATTWRWPSLSSVLSFAWNGLGYWKFVAVVLVFAVAFLIFASNMEINHANAEICQIYRTCQ